MLRRLAAALLIPAPLIACSATSVVNQVQPAGNEVIALERAALDRWGRGDVGGFMSLYADEVTYFDPFQERRVDGLSVIRALYEPLAGKFTVDRYEMLNPKVQRYGDVAVLTYNLQNYARQADGTERPATRWNSSAVFRRIDGKWRTIHSHWSFTKPNIRSPGSQ
jgi:ketosteroid isomerase-like protein